MIHNQFLYGLPNLIGGSTQEIPSHLAFSSDEVTINETDSSLSGEAGSRIALETPEIVNNTITFIGVRSSVVPPSGGTYLNASGLFTSDLVGELWATTLIPSLLHTSSFDLEVRHSVRFNRYG